MILIHNFKREYQAIQKEIDDAVHRVLSSGWFILGREVFEFEREVCNYLQVQHAIGVANGMEALEIALKSLGIGPGDEVITTPLSAAATTLAIINVGAKPVFVDIDEFGHIDVELIESQATKNTKAILPVHLYGQSCDIPALQTICRKHPLLLIEDAAQAFGADFNGQKLGTFGDVGCFSFYPTKNLGAYGDGGMIVTNKIDVAQKAMHLRDYGQSQKYIHEVVGMNSRLDEIQAAILQVKLRFIDPWNKKRNQIAETYHKAFREIPSIRCLPCRKQSYSNYHLFAIRVKNRDVFQKHLEENGIQTAIHYPLPITCQKFLSHNESLPRVDALCKEIVSLPIDPLMTDAEIEQVISTVQSAPL